MKSPHSLKKALLDGFLIGVVFGVVLFLVWGCAAREDRYWRDVSRATGVVIDRAP